MRLVKISPLKISVLIIGLFLSNGVSPAITSEQIVHLNGFNSLNDYAGGIAYLKGLLQQNPRDYDAMLHLSYSYAYLRQTDSTLYWLEKAVNYGFTDYNLLDADSFWNSLRKTSGFVEIREKCLLAALEENDAKTIRLKSGIYTEVPLNSHFDLPQIELSMSFDVENLYIRAKVQDTHFRGRHLSQTDGDGFVINFADPQVFDQAFTQRYLSLGFSYENKAAKAVLLGQNGDNHRIPLPELSPQVTIAKNGLSADYQITIPWKNLYPYHPLTGDKAGINIIYHSVDEDYTQKKIKYIQDFKFDAEDCSLRRFAPVEFEFIGFPKDYLFAKPDTRLLTGAMLKMQVFTLSEKDRKPVVEMTLTDSTGKTAFYQKQPRLELITGQQAFQQSLQLPNNLQGLFKVNLMLDGNVVWRDKVLIYDKGRLKLAGEKIRSSFANPYDFIYTSSRDALLYRIEEIEQLIANFDDRRDPGSIDRKITELYALQAEWNKSKSIYLREGVLQSAFQSSADSSLQPFIIILPKKFSPEKAYDLLIVLRGGDGDENSLADSAAQIFGNKHFIIAAPRGRYAVSYWQKLEETDVCDLTETLSKMFKIKRTLCYGYALGGPGTWRMVLRHPELFDAGIAAFGPVDFREFDFNGGLVWSGLKVEAKKRPIIVLSHSGNNADTMRKAEEFINEMREEGFDVTLQLVESGRTDNEIVAKSLGKWLKKKYYKIKKR